MIVASYLCDTIVKFLNPSFRTFFMSMYIHGQHYCSWYTCYIIGGFHSNSACTYTILLPLFILNNLDKFNVKNPRLQAQTYEVQYLFALVNE